MWIVEKVREDRVEHRAEHSTAEAALEEAVRLAEEEGLIREDGEGDDFMAMRASWTRAELCEQLEESGSCEDGEVRISVAEE